MSRLRSLPPWQIILLSLFCLGVFAFASYFVVTRLTTPDVTVPVKTTVPANLESEQNRQVLEKLDSFDAPQNLPNVSGKLRTPDPNAPSTVNPFK